jgi:hypothetical protein
VTYPGATGIRISRMKKTWPSKLSMTIIHS